MNLIGRELIVVRNHQNVNIAALVLLAARKRAEDQGDGDPPPGRGERAAQPLPHADSADDDLLERLEDRRIAVGPKKPLPVAAENSAVSQQFQLPLHRTGPPAGPADDFAQVKRFIRPQEHQRQNRLPRASEENVAEFEGRNHIECNRTYLGCT